MKLNKVTTFTLLDLYHPHIQEGDFMEKRERRPVHIKFENAKEAVDLRHRIALKYFLLALLYNTNVMRK